MLDACSLRLLDFVVQLVSPESIPMLTQAWSRLEKARSTAYDEPWSHAVLRTLELEQYQRRGFKDSRWIGKRLGISEEVVGRSLAALEEAGQVKKLRGRYRAEVTQSVNTGRDPERARQLKATCCRVALERLEAGQPGLFGYSVFAVSRQRLRRIRELQLEYVRAMQELVAGSDDNECVGLYCVQLLDLSQGTDNVLRVESPETPRKRG